MALFTPGPWHCQQREDHDFDILDSSRELRLATVKHSNLLADQNSEGAANTRLISQASEMFRLLNLLCVGCTDASNREREELGHGITSLIRESKSLLKAIVKP